MRTHNSIISSLISQTNIFGIGKSFHKMQEYSGLNLNDYAMGELLSGLKIIIGEIFRDCKIISIKGIDGSDDIEITGNPVVYNKDSKKYEPSSEIKTFVFQRNNFATLKLKKY